MSFVGLNMLMLLGFMLLAGSCSAKVYNVGDSAGWTTIGNVDYNQWAASKTFQIGDVIMFKYNPQFHNVMEVTQTEYNSCNAASPISVHTTGMDNFTMTTQGHHLFICGAPNHCQAGQKVDINVLPVPTSPSSSTPTTTNIPAPSNKATKAPTHFALGLVVIFFLCLLF